MNATETGKVQAEAWAEANSIKKQIKRKKKEMFEHIRRLQVASCAEDLGDHEVQIIASASTRMEEAHREILHLEQMLVMAEGHMAIIESICRAGTGIGGEENNEDQG